MTVQFPDPDTTQEFDYLNDEGLVIRYSWDGEKWLASGVIGGTADLLWKELADGQLVPVNPDGYLDAGDYQA